MSNDFIESENQNCRKNNTETGDVKEKQGNNVLKDFKNKLMKAKKK